MDLVDYKYINDKNVNHKKQGGYFKFSKKHT